MAVEGPVRLSKQQVFSMSKELLDGFSTRDFQKKLQDLLHGNLSAHHVPGRNELALTVQSRVLPKYGIPGTAEGVLKMLAAVSPFMDDWLLQQMEWIIYEKLGINDETSIDKFMGAVRSPTKKKRRALTLTLARSEVSNPPRFVEATKKKRRALTLTLGRSGVSNPPRPVEDRARLTRDQVLSMTKEFLWEISALDFQEKLENLHDMPRRIELTFVALSKVLPKYGIPCALQGSAIMLEAISPFLNDWMLQDILERIDVKLGMHNEHFVDELKSFLHSSHKHAKIVPVRMTKKEVLSMVNELLEGFSTSEFQLNLQKLQCNSQTANQAAVRSTPALTVQSNVLQRYGIPGSLKGIEIMLEAIMPFMDDWRLHQMLGAINDKFRADLKTPDIIVPNHQPTVTDGRSLTKHHMLSMAEELLDGFSTPDFQLKLHKLLCASRREDTVESESMLIHDQGFVPGRRELAFTVQSEVLPKYGIPGTPEGVQIMKTIMARFMDDDMQQIQRDIEDALGMNAERCVGKLAEIHKLGPQEQVHTANKSSEASTVNVFPENPPMPNLLQNKESVVHDKLGMTGKVQNKEWSVHDKLRISGKVQNNASVVYEKLGMSGEVEVGTV